MNTETVIVIGNGFDLDLGWDTSYRSFFNKHDGWKMHRRDEDKNTGTGECSTQ